MRPLVLNGQAVATCVRPKDLVFAMALAAAACDRPVDSEPACKATQAIVSGTMDSGFLGLTEQQRNAVVFLSFVDDDGSEFERCSGVLVAPGLVLTAKHCVRDEAEFSVGVRFGADAETPDFTVHTRATRAHETLDLLLVEFEPPTDLGAYAEPIPRMPDALDLTQLASVAELAGYGRTETFEAGKRLFVAEPIRAWDGASVTVDGSGYSGACVGDSGGPLLTRDPSGSVRVLGILSEGSASCAGTDRYVRLDVVGDFVAAPERSIEGTPCGAIDEVGSCYGSTALWCEGGTLRAIRCGEETACGWDTRRAGFGCVTPEDDPCMGIPDHGMCEGAVLLRCTAGRATARDCLSCADACGVSPISGSAACIRRVATDD